MTKTAQQIDPVAVARSILEDRHRAFTVSTVSLFAICQALVDATDSPQSIITTHLAQALRHLFDVIEHPPIPDPAFTFAIPETPLKVAFKAAKTLFEEEFPE